MEQNKIYDVYLFLLFQMVVANFENTTQHGAIIDKKQTHLVEHYNLDMIISVGYRVKSKRGITFRKWSTKVLKEHLIKGYNINQKRLENSNNTEIKRILILLSITCIVGG